MWVLAREDQFKAQKGSCFLGSHFPDYSRRSRFILFPVSFAFRPSTRFSNENLLWRESNPLCWPARGEFLVRGRSTESHKFVNATLFVVSFIYDSTISRVLRVSLLSIASTSKRKKIFSQVLSRIEQIRQIVTMFIDRQLGTCIMIYQT